jgi:uncharacterized protein
MPSPAAGPTTRSPVGGTPRGRRAILDRHRWLVFLLPFIVFMLAGSLEPTPDKAGGSAIGLAIPYTAYPLVYTLKIALTVAAMAFVWPGYREFPLRVSPLAVGVGIVGVFVWVWLAKAGFDRRILASIAPSWFGDLGQRPGFDPLTQIGQPAWAWAFLAVRFLGLAAIVPVIEEFFLRGFVMRVVMAPDWWKVPFGKVNAAAVAVAVVVPVLTHPGEMLAAAVWFSLVTLLMVWTRNLWDCVAAHAVTNLLLGIYVVLWHDWVLW